MNIRGLIINDIKSLAEESSKDWSSKKLMIETSLNPPVFTEFDLPMLHINFGDETIDEYLVNDSLTDMRRSPISLHFFLDHYEVGGKRIPFIDCDEEVLREASAYMEGIVSSVDSAMKKYRFMYPRGLVKIIMNSVDYTISKESDPKVGRVVMEYSSQYQVTVSEQLLKR